MSCTLYLYDVMFNVVYIVFTVIPKFLSKNILENLISDNLNFRTAVVSKNFFTCVNGGQGDSVHAVGSGDALSRP